MSTSPPVLQMQLFLSRQAASAVSADGERGALFALRDPSGFFPNGVTVRWMGPAAAAFLEAHLPELRPGRGLQVRLHRITSHEYETRARALACELLPMAPSWQHKRDAQAPCAADANR